jgi:hypothetical protein
MMARKTLMSIVGSTSQMTKRKMQSAALLSWSQFGTSPIPAGIAHSIWRRQFP